MQIKVFDKGNKKGIVERRLIDTRKFFSLAQKFGVEFELSFDDLLSEYQSSTFKVIALAVSKKFGNSFTADLVEKSAKSQFADNFVWKFIKKHFDLDLQIPLVTGMYTRQAIRKNLVVNTGLKIYADRVGGTNSQGAVTAIAIGTNSTAAAATDTALGTEITTNGGARGAATVSNITTSTTGDTEQWQKTFTFTGSFTVTEEGLFDNNTSGGNMLSHQVFTGVGVVNGDTLQVTHKIQS